MSEPNSKLFRDDPATYYVELGKKLEQERIIKMLETYDAYIGRDELIKAIKGEQK